jgi:hypothetical protein
MGSAVGNIIATIMTSQSAMKCRAWPTAVISVAVWLCQIRPAQAAAASAKSKANRTLR